MRSFGVFAFSAAGAAALGLGLLSPSAAYADTKCTAINTTPIYTQADPNSPQNGSVTQSTAFNWGGNQNAGPDGKIYIYGFDASTGTPGWVLQSDFFC